MTIPALSSCAPEITVAIATIGARQDNIILPASVVGLRYEIAVQRPIGPLPHSPRADVRYTQLETIGLSHSRNSALAQCETDLLVFADDDMALDTQGLLALAQQMTDAPQLGFAAGWRAGRMPARGRRSRNYQLHKYNSGRLCAPEVMVRTSAVRSAGVTFDPHFGVGAPLPVGEDYVFVCDMLDAGLTAQAFPIITGAHPDISTGDDWDDPELLVARRAVLSRCFGLMAPVMRLAYVIRHRKRLGGWAAACRFWTGRINSADQK